jgi:hypothetical protein
VRARLFAGTSSSSQYTNRPSPRPSPLFDLPLPLIVIVLPFAFALSFSFALACLPDVISIASARFDVCREVPVLVDEVIGEVSEGASENVVVIHFPCGDEGIKLWPTLYSCGQRFIDSLEV